MAQLKIATDDFSIICPFTCRTVLVYMPMPGSETAALADTMFLMKDVPELQTAYVRFNVNVPKGGTITSAKLYATLGSPLYGANTCKINGVGVSPGDVCIDVQIDDGATSVDVPFQFKCGTPSHAHALDPSKFSHIDFMGDYEYHNYYFPHESVLECENVYLLIEYKPAIEFTGWTDDPLRAGETYVKAVHMTELQQWAAVLSEYANNGTPIFTEAVSGETSLAKWLSQVQEIRAVMDVVDPNHEAWIDVSVNCPRADVMTQIREIIVAAM